MGTSSPKGSAKFEDAMTVGNISATFIPAVGAVPRLIPAIPELSSLEDELTYSTNSYVGVDVSSNGANVTISWFGLGVGTRVTGFGDGNLVFDPKSGAFVGLCVGF